MDCALLASSEESKGLKVPFYIETVYMHPGWVYDREAASLLPGAEAYGKVPFARVTQTLVIDSTDVSCESDKWSLMLYQNGPVKGLRCDKNGLLDKDDLTTRVINLDSKLTVTPGREYHLRTELAENGVNEATCTPKNLSIDERQNKVDFSICEYDPYNIGVGEFRPPFTKFRIVPNEGATKGKYIVRFTYDKLVRYDAVSNKPFEEVSFQILCPSRLNSRIISNLNALDHGEIADHYHASFSEVRTSIIKPKFFSLETVEVPSEDYYFLPSVYQTKVPVSNNTYKINERGRNWHVDSYWKTSYNEEFQVSYSARLSGEHYDHRTNIKFEKLRDVLIERKDMPRNDIVAAMMGIEVALSKVKDVMNQMSNVDHSSDLNEAFEAILKDEHEEFDSEGVAVL